MSEKNNCNKVMGKELFEVINDWERERISNIRWNLNTYLQ